jgi:two-component system, NtrC family, sensor kinase
MGSGKDVDHCLLLRVGVVAKGSRCLSIIRLLESIKPTRLRLKLVSLAPTTMSISCLKFASESGIHICEDYLELLTMDNLDMIMEMTGETRILMDLVSRKRASLGILDLQTSMLLFDIARQYEMVARKESEISLATSFASAMLEASPDSVMVLDQDFRIVKCNSFPLIKRGKGREPVIGKYCFEVLHGSLGPCNTSDRICPVQETFMTRRPARSVHEITMDGGETRTCHVTSYPLFNRLGEIVQVVEVIRDISEELRTRVERHAKTIQADLTRVVQEDRLASLGRLVASVCHEINNPISSIITFNKLILAHIRDQTLPPEGLSEFMRYLELCVQEAMRCGNIVKNLLSFARQKSIEPNEIDLIEMVRTILMLTAHQLNMAQVETQLNLPDPPFAAWGDYALMQQCLMNLIFNAMESMPKGGRMNISGGRGPGDKQVWLSITDTGQGIPPDELSRIFDPFYSTKLSGRGVGLGLSMVYGIIREHHGTVEVRSEPGKGTVFKIILPIERTTSEMIYPGQAFWAIYSPVEENKAALKDPEQD